MTGNDTTLLVVTGGISSKLENLSAEVFQNSSQVDRCSTANALRISTFLQVASNPANRELKSRLGGAGSALSLLLATSSFSFSRHNN